ncbi:hypothetical protein LSH36_34g08000 [Paralvinella palmiformis]|uniref:Uncharacterized protein n=1 Tax=Paralvinella palmiformis TaxID=53620 RepID=A0AAD9NE18_9ANNE|nr:hypothetical protein LSH36_34g08000 [Paralvinella palmiformis]
MADVRLWVCCNSYDDEKLQRNRSRAIDKQIKQEKLHFRRTVKILLLGSGESGKSTFLKQMRIIHGDEFGEDDLQQYKTVIYGNIIKGMKVLIDARDKLHIPWGNEKNAIHADKVWSYSNNILLDEPIFLHYVSDLLVLWDDSGIKNAFDRRREFQLMLNGRIFITNKQDSNGRLAVSHLTAGNTQALCTHVECSERYHQRTRFQCLDT